MADVFMTLLSISLHPIPLSICKQTTGRGLQRDSRDRLPTSEAILESMSGAVRCIGIAEAGPFPISAFHDQIGDWSAREHQLRLESPTIVVEGQGK